jgi:DNA glycosylase AlkZ-like
MDGLEIAHRRLHNQHLTGTPLPDPVAVVRHMGAMQAQEYAVARWSVAQRTTGVDDAAMRRAVDDGLIVRTHALRPTWHFVAAEDLRWIQALTGPRVHAFNGYYYRQMGINATLAAKAADVMAAAVADGNHLTRKELGQALATAGIEATGNRLAYLVLHAELEAVLCNGPMRGKQHTYALVSERIPAAPSLSPDEALARLTATYFRSHGPATIKDFSWWSSLTITQIKLGLSLVDGLESIDSFYYFPSPYATEPGVWPLQGYDEYVVAYSESKWVFNVAARPFGTFSENALLHPLIVDGQLAGFWRRVVRRDGIRVELPGSLSAYAFAFDRYAEFAGVPVTVGS